MVKELHPRDRYVARTRREAPLLEVQQIRANLLLSELIRRSTIISHQSHHCCNVGLLRAGREVPQLHLLDHLGPQCSHKKSSLDLILGATLNQMIKMSQEGK